MIGGFQLSIFVYLAEAIDIPHVLQKLPKLPSNHYHVKSQTVHEQVVNRKLMSRLLTSDFAESALTNFMNQVLQGKSKDEQIMKSCIAHRFIGDHFQVDSLMSRLGEVVG